MKPLTQPETIFAHESDLDGFVSGFLLQRLARRLFGAEVRLEPAFGQAWRSRAFPERVAWVADFAFEARVDRPNWLIVDHHPTAVAPKQATLVHDPAKSSSLLCYELCREQGLGSPELDRLVHLTNVGDLFLLDSPDFLLANDYGNLVKSYQFRNLAQVIEGRLETLLDHPLLEVMAAKRRVEDPIGLSLSRRSLQRLSDTVGYVETVIGNANLIVHELLMSGASPYPVLLTLFRKGNGMVVVSVRSRNGEAVAVAERLQGGGHPNAAGATLPRSIQQIPDALDYLRRVLNPPPVIDSGASGLNGLFA